MIFQLPQAMLPTGLSALSSLYPIGQLICQLFSVTKDLRFLSMYLSGSASNHSDQILVKYKLNAIHLTCNQLSTYDSSENYLS